jgi:WD40 repeat protein
MRKPRTYNTKAFPSPLEVSSLDEGSRRAYGLTSLTLNPSGSKLYAACTDNTIHEYSTHCISQPFKSFSAKTLKTDSFYIRTTVSPDGAFVSSGSKDGGVHIWEVDAPWKPPMILKGHSAEVSCVAWCPSDFDQVCNSMSYNRKFERS